MSLPPYLENKPTDNIFITSLGNISHCTVIFTAGIFIPISNVDFFYATVILLVSLSSLRLEHIAYFLCAFVSTSS